MSDGDVRVVDAATLRKDVDERPDVCVVGSGAGGAVVAARLKLAVIAEEAGFFHSLHAAGRAAGKQCNH